MRKKSLVVYFSYGGAAELADKELTGAPKRDSHPLGTQEAYIKEDLGWKNSQSRSSAEVQDEKVRPSYKELLVDLKDYEQIFLGFPIWWGTGPRIIDHFIEQEDLKGKEVIPFVASGGSTIDKTQDRLGERYGQGPTLLKGHRFNRNLERQEVEDRLQVLSY